LTTLGRRASRERPDRHPAGVARARARGLRQGRLGQVRGRPGPRDDDDRGTIRIRLDVRRAPKTTASFAGLVRSTFFDGLSFHRVARPGGNDFVIQGGDPRGNGDGGPGYTVLEAPPRGTRYRRYDVAMAKTQTEPPGTSGSQFFIVTGRDPGLEPVYAILGRVVGDKSAVRRIAAVPTDPTFEVPLDPVVMSSVRITSRRR
jgi:peptidyl-prolyl cis-trans isomerase B (cyclophilin B)